MLYFGGKIMNKQQPVFLSGIRPTGPLHLGNYFGAIAQFIALQAEGLCNIFVADIHALTEGNWTAMELREATLHVIKMYLACGFDPSRGHIFVQSQIPETMALASILNNSITLSQILGLPTFKDKIGKKLKNDNSSQKDLQAALAANMGWVEYPILMAADILGVQADFVPVGADQTPHIEMTRNIARVFNNVLPDIFTIPEARYSKVPRIPGLDGAGKMGKTAGNTINLIDTPDVIAIKIRRAMTDPGRARRTDPGTPENCGFVYPLLRALQAHEEVTGKCQQSFEIGGWGCTHCKKHLTERLVELLLPIQQNYAGISDEQAIEVAAVGKTTVQPIIRKTLYNTQQALGLLI